MTLFIGSIGNTGTIMLCCFFLFCFVLLCLRFIYLFEGVMAGMYRKRERSSICYLHSPDGQNIWGWARLKLGSSSRSPLRATGAQVLTLSSAGFPRPRSWSGQKWGSHLGCLSPFRDPGIAFGGFNIMPQCWPKSAVFLHAYFCIM